MRLAWRNLSYDRLRFAVTVIGIVFAMFLMVYQGSLLAGFVRASSRMIEASDADIWIVARGVPCFEYAALLPDRFHSLARGVAGVAEVNRVITGVATWQAPSGAKQLVVLVGAEPGAGRDFPLPRLRPDGDDRGEAMAPEAVLIDRSSAAPLEATDAPIEVEINRRRARVERSIEDFGTFLGSPYAFASYPDTADYLKLGREETMGLMVRVAPGYAVETVQRDLQARLPETDVWMRAEFAARSRSFWLNQTGAGGAISLAGMLGFMVGLVVVSQTIYSTTMDNLEEFATLKALGAPRRYVLGVVLTQALASGLVGSAIGLAVTLPLLSKGGIESFTYAIAKEYGSRGIRANAVRLGAVRTKMIDDLPQEAQDAMLQDIFVKDIPGPDCIAWLVASLLSPEQGAYITGSVVTVDGGFLVN